MNIRFSKVLNTVAILYLVALSIIVIPSFFDPEFEVVNNASEPVSATAFWRDQEKELGNLLPGSASRFSVSDEAAMVFRVFYAKGKMIESEPIYFTSGIEVIVNVSDEEVDVRYAFER